ncbi:MAG: hypothetical protein GC164_09995 [Phycisphaera sp.]|nr:hypothetical protein [Phycisphaera sp.]
MLRRSRKAVNAFIENDHGKMSVEMILLLAVIALPIIIALIAFRDKIGKWFGARDKEIEGGAETPVGNR